MQRMADFDGDYFEDVAFCEGATIPLERNRTGELAMECWNMKKDILEQSSQTLKLKKEIKSLKNLVKSLQRCVSDVEADNLIKARELHAKKLTILECDKKVHEVMTNNNILNSSFIRSKKTSQTLQHKLDASQRENQVLQEKL
jgi:chromosome segregation ATPase